VAGVTFVTGLAAAAIVLTLGQKVLRANGVYVQKVAALTEVRVLMGTAALLAVAAVFALALGVLLRRGTVAVTAAVLTVVLPYLLAMTILPTGAGQWLLRITPAAAFALQQTTPQYTQVANLYTPPNGYFPLPPWAGLAVLVIWTAVALVGAAVLLNRRDA
jgi:ABC-type transport system involved in multi-copper enzyme maturation permease subunit